MAGDKSPKAAPGLSSKPLSMLQCTIRDGDCSEVCHIPRFSFICRACSSTGSRRETIYRLLETSNSASIWEFRVRSCFVASGPLERLSRKHVGLASLHHLPEQHLQSPNINLNLRRHPPPIAKTIAGRKLLARALAHLLPLLSFASPPPSLAAITRLSHFLLRKKSPRARRSYTADHDHRLPICLSGASRREPLLDLRAHRVLFSASTSSQ